MVLMGVSFMFCPLDQSIGSSLSNIVFDFDILDDF
jgi:hypothetical protein